MIQNPSRVFRVEGRFAPTCPFSTGKPMYFSYPDLIEESVPDLAQQERAHRGTPREIRLNMLRLLKAGTFRSGSALAPVLSYSKRQLKRWFDAYREGGLEGLRPYWEDPGRLPQLTGYHCWMEDFADIPTS